MIWGKLLHRVVAGGLSRRIPAIEQWMRAPDAFQQQLFRQLMAHVARTQFGKDHGLAASTTVSDFQARVPIVTYEQHYPYIERALKGERDVLWPGRPGWFAKSSGTTNDRSKYIPLTPESFAQLHFHAGRDLFAWYIHNHESSHALGGRALSIGGSSQVNTFPGGGGRYGDLSACLIENMPGIYRLLRTPSRAIALMDEWEAKIEAMAQAVYHQNVVTIHGVPTWTVVLIRRLLALYHARTGTAAPSLRTLWPNLEVFFHGAVSFTPYRTQFRQLIPEADMRYWETYNASEGYFGFTYRTGSTELVCTPNHGTFYEFAPLDELGSDHPRTVLLHEVEAGRQYAPIISTVGGLWRYLLGDTVRITRTDPICLEVSGRTQHYINTFGEELMVANTDAALAHACEATGAVITDYTAAPIYFAGEQAGGHEWVIEFATPPPALAAFVALLDSRLQALNTDYAAKRHKDLALRPPVVHVAPPGTFEAWLKAKGKLGGQHKVPRLKNDRSVLEEVRSFLIIL